MGDGPHRASREDAKFVNVHGRAEPVVCVGGVAVGGDVVQSDFSPLSSSVVAFGVAQWGEDGFALFGDG